MGAWMEVPQNKNCRGRWDGFLVSKRADCCQAWRSEFNFHSPYSRRELASRSHSLTLAYMKHAYITLWLKNHTSRNKLCRCGRPTFTIAIFTTAKIENNPDVHQWMNKGNVFYIWTLFRHLKEGHLGIWWYVTLITWETETGRTLVPRSLMPAWATQQDFIPRRTERQKDGKTEGRNEGRRGFTKGLGKRHSVV